MGLVVENYLVTVDHAVTEHLVTTVDGNPKVSTTECGLRVMSVFTRIKASAKGRRDVLYVWLNASRSWAASLDRTAMY